MNNAKVLIPLIVAGMITLFAGCKDNSTGPSNENGAPTAILSASATDVEAGQTVELDGTGSSDPDGDDLSYSWSFTAPDGSTTTLSDASVADPVFVADIEGDYVVTLTVSDGQAESSGDVGVNN